MVNGPFSVSNWLFNDKVVVPAPKVPREIPPTAVPLLRNTVRPALVMMAVSLALGTLFGSQLRALSQPPLAVLVQLRVAAWREVSMGKSRDRPEATAIAKVER